MRSGGYRLEAGGSDDKGSGPRRRQRPRPKQQQHKKHMEQENNGTCHWETRKPRLKQRKTRTEQDFT